jgi:deazaflavin-dependent oxidoreductase (nitroreductase family)
MPIPAAIGKINRQITNRITSLFAGRIPPFAIVEHRGRRSGTLYRTPIMAFRRNGDYVFALTYGAGADWVRNVLAASQCDLIRSRKRIHLVDPRSIETSEGLAQMPAPARLILRLANVTEFLKLSTSP